MIALFGCEESQECTKAFRERGIEAYSNDLEECSGGHPEWHLKMDVFEALAEINPDLFVCFPPCTDLAVSGAKHFAWKRANGQQQRSIDFFLQFTKRKGMWAIENPIGIMSTIYRKPNQIIQPWQFGHGEVKSTCLWLNDLPLLQPTNIVSGRYPKVWKMGPSANRAKLRSKTYPGIALAMAEQWGNNDYLRQVA